MVSGNRERKRNGFSFIEVLHKENLLHDYLTTSFNSPLNYEVVLSLIGKFSQYWRNLITYSDLVRVCPFNEEELINTFGLFLKNEDLKNR